MVNKVSKRLYYAIFQDFLQNDLICDNPETRIFTTFSWFGALILTPKGRFFFFGDSCIFQAHRRDMDII